MLALAAVRVVLCAGQPDVLDRIRDSDDLYICAYPYFNVSEMLAVARLYQKSTAQSGKPIIVFNGAACRPPPHPRRPEGFCQLSTSPLPMS